MDQVRKEIKCDLCGEVFNHQGGFNLHNYHCRMRNGKPTAKAEKAIGCEHEYRLLNPQNELENKAIKNNYSEVCKKCLNLQ